MDALIFSEGNGYGHVARDRIIAEHFDIPIMTFGKGAEYCRKRSMDFIEIPTPYLIETGKGKVKIATNVKELIGFFRPEVINTIRRHFLKVDFVIVDGSPLGLAMAMFAGKKSIYITNDTSALVGVHGMLQQKVAASLLSNLLRYPRSVIVPDFPPPLTASLPNLTARTALTFVGPLTATRQIKHGKKYAVVGPLEKSVRPLLGNSAVYGSQVNDISQYYGDAELAICHGGHSSIMEALSNGTPVLCIVDSEYPERLNTARMLERLQVGVVLENRFLSSETLTASIAYAKTLNRERLRLYKSTAKKLQPLKIIEKAISGL